MLSDYRWPMSLLQDLPRNYAPFHQQRQFRFQPSTDIQSHGYISTVAEQFRIVHPGDARRICNLIIGGHRHRLEMACKIVNPIFIWHYDNR